MPAVTYTLKHMSCLVLLLACVVPAHAQDVKLVPCGQVHFFEEACTPPTPPPPPMEKPKEPLFTPETMAPDTPPLLFKLLLDPTPDNAREYVSWQRERLQRMQEVQQLLRSLGDKKPLP